jgi:predicted enzyme related to lactoylglutathione lyase
VKPYIRNVVFDCEDARKLSVFWAEALGWTEEIPPEHQRELIAAERGERAFDDRVMLVDPAGVEARLFFQQVPEKKVVKNRVHLDLNVENADAEVERLLELGATNVVWHVDRLGPFVERWAVLQDPEGNEFCVQGEDETELP